MNLTDLRPQYGRALLSREISESMLVYYIEVLTSEKAPYRPFRICQRNKQLILQDNLLTMVGKGYLFNYFSTVLTLLKGICFQKRGKKERKKKNTKNKKNQNKNLPCPQFSHNGTTVMPTFSSNNMRGFARGSRVIFLLN